MAVRRRRGRMRRSAALCLALAAACGTPPKPVPPEIVEAREKIVLLCGAMENHALLNRGEYPRNLELLVITDFNPSAFLSSRKPLIDPWGEPFLYDQPRPGVRGYRIFTYGKDGRAGGDGLDADMDNWMIEDGEL